MGFNQERIQELIVELKRSEDYNRYDCFRWLTDIIELHLEDHSSEQEDKT